MRDVEFALARRAAEPLRSSSAALALVKAPAITAFAVGSLRSLRISPRSAGVLHLVAAGRVLVMAAA